MEHLCEVLKKGIKGIKSKNKEKLWQYFAVKVCSDQHRTQHFYIYIFIYIN